jgi:hypothetical protein
MRQSKILGLPKLCLFGFVACAQSDPEPPMTPASYTHTPGKPDTAAPARRTASRPAQETRSLAQKAPAQNAPPPVITGTEGDDSSSALVLARCNREARCNTIGEDKEYGTEEDCITRLKPDTERELEASECPRRIPPAPLGACMEAIRKESCDRPRELALIEECGKAVLCSKQ